MHTARHTRARSRGFTLVEVLVAILVFSLGVLGLVRLQATAVKMSSDARHRAEATWLADQLLARMLISDPATASAFAHRAGAGAACAPTGPNSTHPLVTEWLAQVSATFPRAAPEAQQIVVNGTDVTVRLCWRSGENEEPRSFEVSNRVQWP